MVRMMERFPTTEPVRWSTIGLFVALGIWSIPDLRAAGDLPLALEVARGIGTVAILVLAVLLVRARHEPPARKFPLGVAIVTLMLLSGAVQVGFSPKSAALMAAWAALVWIEWRRLADAERPFA